MTRLRALAGPRCLTVERAIARGYVHLRSVSTGGLIRRPAGTAQFSPREAMRYLRAMPELV